MMLSRAEIHLLLSLRDSFKTRSELDSEDLCHRDTLSKCLRRMEEFGFILRTPREMDGRYTAEFNLTKWGREMALILESFQLGDMPETGLTKQRWRIMLMCRESKRFGAIRDELAIAEPNVDRQLKILLGAGMIEKETDAYILTPGGSALVRALEQKTTQVA